MRRMTMAIAGIVVLVVGFAAIWSRAGVEREDVTPARLIRRRVVSVTPSADRSGRVDQHLGLVRDHFQRDADVPKAEVNRRQVAAIDPKQGEAAGSAGDDTDLEDPDEMQQLRRTLFDDPDPEERIKAVTMLIGEEGQESLRMLLEAMDDPDPEVRLAVVEALGDRAEELTPESLTLALRDSDAKVRLEAVSILEDMDTTEARQMVRSATHDEDEEVRALAEGM